MPPVGFEPTISTEEQPKTYANVPMYEIKRHKIMPVIHKYAKYGILTAVLLKIELVAQCRRLSAS